MTKDVEKVIMDRSRLRNKFNQNYTSENCHEYKRLRNMCANILKWQKKDYLAKIDIRSTDDKTFWNAVKPCHK